MTRIEEIESMIIDGMKYEQLKEQYETRLKTDKLAMLNKIRAEIEQQEDWLIDAGYSLYNVHIAFNAIKLVIDKYKAESEV